MQIQLNNYQKIIYKRYIDAEKQIPDFIAKGRIYEFDRDAFLFIYIAGHGCADFRQIFLLDEKEPEKIFWKVELDSRKILDRCGKFCKLFAIYDCCREDYQEALKKVLKIQAQF